MKRYDFNFELYDDSYREEKNGDWVKYEDIEPLLKELTERLKNVRCPFCEEKFDAIDWVDDGCGLRMDRWCDKCSGERIVFKPGDIRCSECEN